VPAIVTDAPTAPEVGPRLVMLGGGAVTLKLAPLLTIPMTATVTLPVVAPAGTGTMILVGLQVVADATTPLNEMVLEPWKVPKPLPVIVTDVPAGPEEGLRLVMLGGRTVKLTPLLATPPTVTTKLPEFVVGTVVVMLAAAQLVVAPENPLSATVLVP
jgi:hypothetical protein